RAAGRGGRGPLALAQEPAGRNRAHRAGGPRRCRTGIPHRAGAVARMIELTTTNARAIAQRVRVREISAVEVARSALDRIARLDGALHAFITVTPEHALRAAEEVDRRVAAGDD